MKGYTRYPPTLHLRLPTWLYRVVVVAWYVWAVAVCTAAIVLTAYLLYGLFWVNAGPPDRVYQRDF